MISVQLVLCSLVLYAALQLAVGLLAARRSDNATFFTASRRVPWQVTWGAMISAAIPAFHASPNEVRQAEMK